jgi:hypothetical protein
MGDVDGKNQNSGGIGLHPAHSYIPSIYNTGKSNN